MGSSVYSSFLLPNLLSGVMILKSMVVLCLTLVVFIEAKVVPVPGQLCLPEDDCNKDVDGKKKRSPDVEAENGIDDDEPITENKLNEALDITSNESEDITDDSEQMDVTVTSLMRKRSARRPYEYTWPYACNSSI